MKKISKLFVLSLFCASFCAQAATTVVRVMAAPNSVYNPAKAADMAYAKVIGSGVYDSDGAYILSTDALKNRWTLTARYQTKNAVSSIVDFDPSAMTGVAVPSGYQRGMVGGSVPQTTYQLSGYNVGMLNMSWDYDGNLTETHPAYVNCPSNPGGCRGIHKHTAYTYHFFPPMKMFQDSSDDKTSVAIQADGMRVASFEPYNNVNAGGSPATPVGQYYWVVFLRDSSNPSAKDIQMVIVMFQNHSYDGSEMMGVEWVGNTAQPYFVTSLARGDKKLVDVRLDSALDFRTTTWPSMLFSRVHITPRNLMNIVDISNAVAASQCASADRACLNQAFNSGEGWCARNAIAGQYSCDLDDYELVSVGLLQELAYERGDQVLMGSAAYAPAVYELRQD